MYVQSYRDGGYPIAPIAATKKAAPPTGGFCGVDAATKGRSSDTKRQTTGCPRRDVADGFLKTTFLPGLQQMESLLSGRETEKLERDFYTSLSQLAEHYGIPIKTRGYDYPYSIALALHEVRLQLRAKVGNWYDLRLVKDSKDKAFLISEERYGTGSTLYYIPVVPLYSMLHEQKRRDTAQLLLSVCSYLYHIANVPYYTHEDSYLYWHYEMLTDWVEECDEGEGDVLQREMEQAGWIGERIQQKLYDLRNLDYFENRVRGFKVRDGFDRECYRVALNALALCRDYPENSVFQNAPKTGHDPEGEDYDGYECIGMEKYISFIADTKGVLYENLENCVNSEFNECTVIDEPTLVKSFDGSPVEGTNLDFETRLFTLIDNLCYLLFNYKFDMQWKS